jgi:hypothetical protein
MRKKKEPLSDEFLIEPVRKKVLTGEFTIIKGLHEVAFLTRQETLRQIGRYLRHESEKDCSIALYNLIADLMNGTMPKE